MKSQIFKKDIDHKILFNFLDKYSTCNDKYYIFSNLSYQKAKFHKKISSFCTELTPYYHNSKQNYSTRKMNYNNFTTIIRQLCNHCLVNYTSKVEYDNSTYNIVYYIYKK